MNTRVNLLSGNILSSLTRLALPIMTASLIQMAYNLTDMIWIGRVGSGAVAAVGAAGMYMWLSNGISTLPRMGGQVMVAQSLGTDSRESASAYAKNALQLGVMMAAVYGLILLVFNRPLIGLFQLHGQPVIADACVYLKIVGGGVVFSIPNQILTGLITATGNSRTPLAATTAGLVLNILLDPLLIFGFGPIPPMGVGGAAAATVLAQALVTGMFCLHIRRDDYLFAGIHFFSKPQGPYLKTIVRIGYPAAAQGMMFTAISMVIARLIAGFGDGAVAVQKVGSQIESIAWMSADGFSAALNSFVAQNFGAGNAQRARKGYLTALRTAVVWGIFCTLLLVFLPRPIFRIFIQEDKVLPLGVSYLIILGYSQILSCVEIITGGAFSGFSKTVPPAVVGILFTAARIPMARILSGTALGLDGVWWAITISSNLKGSILLIWMMLFLRRQRKGEGL